MANNNLLPGLVKLQHNHKQATTYYLDSIVTFIPSSTVIEVSNVGEDSMDITPSGPILSIASAIISPIYLSFPADIDATAAATRRTVIKTKQLSVNNESLEVKKKWYLVYLSFLLQDSFSS